MRKTSTTTVDISLKKKIIILFFTGKISEIKMCPADLQLNINKKTIIFRAHHIMKYQQY